ncbi:MAG: hypothetical protein ABEJ08_04560 [Halobacteriaceae archaeon]
MKLRDRLGLSERTQRRVTRLLQLSLVGFVFVGVDRGSAGIVVNALVALGASELPAAATREVDRSIDAGLALWLTTAVFLHAVGALGPYQDVWWWDHLTHALSASVVAAVGYATVRALQVHADTLSFPPAFTAVFILLLVVAFGVFWEVLEFALAGVSSAVGSGAVLTQYGLDDTMLDLVFDVVGAAVVAVWGTAHVSGLTDVLVARLSAGAE